MDSPYIVDDLIAAPATPRGRSALAIVRSSGPQCIEVFSNIFSHPEILIDSSGNRIHHGWLVDENKIYIDEVMVSIFRAPFSYTGQDSVEVSCHGGPVVIDRVMVLFRSIGFRDSSPGEFTFRAFFFGKMDLIKAEAVNEIINARTDKARALAISRLAGSVGACVEEAKHTVKHQLAVASLALDYPEDETESIPFDYAALREARLSLEQMIGTWQTSRLYQDGVRIALAGPANAGKSTLFNLFLKEERSIVTEIPGTTRDWVEAWTALDDIPLRLVDTAGLRCDSDDPIELEGIRRTRDIISASDFTIVLVDGCVGAAAAENFYDEECVNLHNDQHKLIRVWNKADEAPNAPDGWIALSALRGSGFSKLAGVLRTRILDSGGAVDENTPIIDSIRQKKLLERSVKALKQFESNEMIPVDLKSEDLQEALNALGEMTGEVNRADILALMFSEFCVGK